MRATCLALLLALPVAGRADWADDLSPLADKDWNAAHAAHLLERAGFGGTPDEVARLTPAEAVDSLLDYDKTPAKLAAFEPSGIYPNGHKNASKGTDHGTAEPMFVLGK